MVVVSLAVALGVAAPALAAQARSSGFVTMARGTLTPDGLAEVTGALPPGRAFTPASYALSRDARFSAGDLPLGTGKLKAKRGRFDAWVALPDEATVGASQLLAVAAPLRHGAGARRSGASRSEQRPRSRRPRRSSTRRTPPARQSASPAPMSV